MIIFQVQELARAKGMSDAMQLAIRAGVSYRTAYKIWNDRFNDEGSGIGILTLQKVARALDVQVKDLFTEHVDADETVLLAS